MDYEKKYKELLEKAKDFNFQGYIDEECLYDMFPELRESEDEKVRKEIIDYCHERLNTTYGALPNIETIKRWLTWLEKQKYTQRDVDDAYLKGITDTKNILEKQDEQILANSAKTCKNEQKTDKYEGYCEGCNNVKGCVTCVDGDQWAHYKEVEQKPIKMWHDVSEVPDEMQELLVERESPDATWHSVAFYDAETKTFRHLKKPIENVTRWAYVSDILSQSVTKISDNVWNKEDDKQLDIAMESCQFLNKIETTNWLESIKDRLKGE